MAAAAPAPASAARQSTNVVILPNGQEFRELQRFQPPRPASNAASTGPTRKVRELPGGGSSQISSLFGGGDAEDEENEPPRRVSQPRPAQTANDTQAPAAATPTTTVKEKQETLNAPTGTFRPTRKVRELYVHILLFINKRKTCQRAHASAPPCVCIRLVKARRWIQPNLGPLWRRRRRRQLLEHPAERGPDDNRKHASRGDVHLLVPHHVLHHVQDAFVCAHGDDCRMQCERSQQRIGWKTFRNIGTGRDSH